MALILIPHQPTGNIYVRELGRAYASAGHTVVYGAENLLEDNTDADLVHLQWPEELYRWRGEGPVDERLEKMFHSLERLQDQGGKIAWTVHNLAPHEHLSHEADARAYEKIIKLADVVVHHCEESVRLLARRYPSAAQKPHVVVPHGHYFSYPNDSDPATARKELGIPESKFVYLHFGQIRGYKGLEGLFDAFAKVKTKSKYLLIAGEYIGRSRPWDRDRIRLAYARRFKAAIGVWTYQIPSEAIQTFMNAADCVVLSHSRGLNSGVAVLGMTFGKVVVGPRLGCIGTVLDQGKNITYEAGQVDELAAAMDRAATSPCKVWGPHNAEIARGWNWTDIPAAVLARLALA